MPPKQATAWLEQQGRLSWPSNRVMASHSTTRTGDHMRTNSLHWGAAGFVLIATIGCATIVGDPTHAMPIASTPSGARIVIVDEHGTEIFKGNTPTTVSLEKSTGKYFGKKSYTVTITKEGYAETKIPITASATGWYIGGNILFGGLIGWLIVDPFNGRMYKLSPENVSANLQPITPSGTGPAATSLNIIPLQDLPTSLRKDLILIAAN